MDDIARDGGKRKPAGGPRKVRRSHVQVRSNASGATDRLLRLLLDAAADAVSWRDVLGEIMRTCGAIKGVITLRDLKTAKLYFPEKANSELAAPLILGIEPEHVASYFDRYAACDVWTPIERQHYPHLPYFMSDHISLAALQRTEFWQWLEPQGIVDCLVAEIYRSPRHWVALNLHFDASVLGRRRAVIDQVCAVLPDVRKGWEISERLIGLDQGSIASQGYLENWSMPCMILDEDLVVTSANSLALHDLPGHCSMSGEIVIGAPVPLRRGPLHDALVALRDHADAPADVQARTQTEANMLLTVASRQEGYSIHISTVAQATDIVGKRRLQFLLLAKADGAKDACNGHAPRIWETGGLTPAQAEIVKCIAEGGVVGDFARRRGVKKDTAYGHLFQARQKLGGISARDIYTTHQALLMLER